MAEEEVYFDVLRSKSDILKVASHIDECLFEKCENNNCIIVSDHNKEANVYCGRSIDCNILFFPIDRNFKIVTHNYNSSSENEKLDNFIYPTYINEDLPDKDVKDGGWVTRNILLELDKYSPKFKLLLNNLLTGKGEQLVITRNNTHGFDILETLINYTNTPCYLYNSYNITDVDVEFSEIHFVELPTEENYNKVLEKALSHFYHNIYKEIRVHFYLPIGKNNPFSLPNFEYKMIYKSGTGLVIVPLS